jgi:hypothetical protein
MEIERASASSDRLGWLPTYIAEKVIATSARLNASGKAAA